MLLLAVTACGAPAQPAGVFRDITRPFEGVSASCWPVPGDPGLSFTWTVTRRELDIEAGRLRMTLQFFGQDPETVLAEVTASFESAGLVQRGTTVAVGSLAAFAGRGYGAVRLVVRPFGDDAAGVPVRGTIELDLPATAASEVVERPCPPERQPWAGRP